MLVHVMLTGGRGLWTTATAAVSPQCWAMRGVCVIGSRLKFTKLPEPYRIVPADSLPRPPPPPDMWLMLMVTGLAAEPLVFKKTSPVTNPPGKVRVSQLDVFCRLQNGAEGTNEQQMKRLTNDLFAVVSSQSNDLHARRDGTFNVRPDAENRATEYVIVTRPQSVFTPRTTHTVSMPNDNTHIQSTAVVPKHFRQRTKSNI